MRSAPPLALCMKLASSTPHCEAAASEPSSPPPFSPPSAPAPSASSASPHSASSASWSIWSLPSVMALHRRSIGGSLDDDFLEQHGVDPAGADRGIDPAGQLLLQAVETGGTVEVARPQLAQIGLECVHHSRHRGLDLRLQHGVGQFEHDLDLEILG